MEMVNSLVNKMSSWIDNLFGLFGFYSERYSPLIVWGFIFMALAKFFKFKFNYTKG